MYLYNCPVTSDARLKTFMRKLNLTAAGSVMQTNEFTSLSQPQTATASNTEYIFGFSHLMKFKRKEKRERRSLNKCKSVGVLKIYP